LLAGFGISGGRTAVKAALLAEEIRLDHIGQGIEAEVWNAEHAATARSTCPVKTHSVVRRFR